ncbi:MAG: hypothetical protein AVDCRST_MAG41-18, partial [uncultured Corynebacteriales bacterium]
WDTEISTSQDRRFRQRVARSGYPGVTGGSGSVSPGRGIP